MAADVQGRGYRLSCGPYFGGAGGDHARNGAGEHGAAHQPGGNPDRDPWWAGDLMAAGGAMVAGLTKAVQAAANLET